VNQSTKGYGTPALYVLLASTGMRVFEALALETRHFMNGGRTIKVEQQVEKDCPRIVKYLKTSAAKREVDLHPRMGWHSFKRYRKTWLRGARCLNGPRRGRASRIWLRVVEDRSCSKCSKNIRHEIGG
jgi:integrase